MRQLLNQIGLLAFSSSFLFLVTDCENLPTRPVAPSSIRIKGLTLADWTPAGYGKTTSNLAIEAAANVGASHLLVIVTAYQPRRSSSSVVADPTRTPTAEAVLTALNKATSLTMEVALKPHVDVDDGTWRALISPTDPSTWFQSYRDFILPWAELAETVGASQFVVGTELAGTLRHQALWLETIESVRAVYSGYLVYAASWDEASNVPFWPALDFVGVNFFFPVTQRSDAGRLEILAGWQPWLQRLERLARQTKRSIILTEIGYRSVDGAGMAPFDFTSGGKLDLAEQADLYWAALEATRDLGWLEGLYWWNWPADGAGGPRNLDYSPTGKPAVEELRAAWAGSG